MFETVVICLTSIALGYVIAMLALRYVKRNELEREVSDLGRRISAMESATVAAAVSEEKKPRKRKARKPVPKKAAKPTASKNEKGTDIPAPEATRPKPEPRRKPEPALAG